MPILNNVRQEAFVQAICAGKTEAEAYRAAGYKPTTQRAAESNSSRLMKNDEVAARLLEVRTAISLQAQTASGVTVTRVLRELERIGFSDLSDVVSWTKAGKLKPTKGSANLGRDLTASIKGIRQTANGLEFLMHDKKDALFRMGQHMGMFQGETANPAGNLTINDNRQQVFIDKPRGETIEEWQARVSPAGTKRVTG